MKEENMIAVPCITLHRPWASWVARGIKTIETRLHSRFKGLAGKWVGIHAGKAFDDKAFGMASPYSDMLVSHECNSEGILCLAWISETRWLTAADSKAALIDCRYTLRFGLIIGKIHLFETPIAMSGSQGIWTAYSPAELMPLAPPVPEGDGGRGR